MKNYSLANYQVVEVQGSDALRFLQGQTTINVSSLAPKCAKFAAHCNLKGRIVANFILCCINKNHYMILTPESTRESLINALKHYGRFSKSSITFNSAIQFHAYQTVDNDEKVNFKLAYPEIFLIKDENKFSHKNNWDHYLIEHGIAIIDSLTAEQFTPQSIDFDQIGGVDFDKGCYTGQEIIARIHFLGQLKDSLYRANIASNIHPPNYTVVKLENGTIAGRLVQCIDGLALFNLRNQYATEKLWLNLPDSSHVLLETVVKVHA